MATLTTPHERALTLLFSELQGAAERQGEAFLGSPGSLADRTNETGTHFWVHRYSDAAGRRQEVYLGKADDPAVMARLGELRQRIDAANSAIASVRLLARAGFATVDRKAYATLASLHNHGVFQAGALLIGSHAYGALLNALGARAVAYSTEDVDIARREQLALSGLPPFIDMLRETGLEFFPVPALHRSAPSTSFAERGGSRLRVDLLVPSPDEDYPIVQVPELGAHAKGLPYLAYLLGASQESAVLSPHGIVMVRVPAPERFAAHKLIVSQLRSRASAKPEKDLRQAATLIEALADRFPEAVKEALGALPKSAVRYAVRGAKALERHLPASEEAAWEELKSLRAR
ncbi:MAG TPA: GSU2403 family nucleotidyltransferase fold protein [Steroidobacteraceae bacterium]|nr:GSU2403 family nucleotidyltransferase fold protein [Steroidobacteraceae bacterium]